ncbi:MAG: hypothetical protein ACK53L_04075, partial [Pirellulaceae bacterium]
MSDSNPEKLFSYVIKQLDKREIAFIDLIEPRSSSAGSQDKNISDAPQVNKIFRKLFKGVIISAGGYSPQTAKEAVENGDADAVSFGRFFISNPDLPQRIKQGEELNKYDRATFYGGGEKGYTDYPTL